MSQSEVEHFCKDVQIKKILFSALHAARDFMDAPSIHKMGTADPVAEVAFDHQGRIPEETKPSKADLSSSDPNMEEVVETMAAADSSISLTNTQDIQHDQHSLIIDVKPSLGVSPSEQFKPGIVSSRGDEKMEELHPAAVMQSDELNKPELQEPCETQATSERKEPKTQSRIIGLGSSSGKDLVDSEIEHGVSERESIQADQDNTNTLLQRSHSPVQYEDESSELSSEMSASASASETETEETDEDVLRRPDTSAFKLPLFECGIRPDDLFSPTKDGSSGRVGPFQLMIASEHSVHKLEEKLDSPAQSPVDAYKSFHATLKREDDNLDGITEEERTRSPSISSETKDTSLKEIELDSDKELEAIVTPKAQTPVSDRQSIVSSLESTGSAVPVEALRSKADYTDFPGENDDVTMTKQANLIVTDNLHEAQKASQEKEEPCSEKRTSKDDTTSHVVSVSQEPQIVHHETSKSETIAHSPEESVPFVQEEKEDKVEDVETKTESQLESETSTAPVTSTLDQTQEEKASLLEEPETSTAVVKDDTTLDVVSVSRESQIVVHETSKSETIAHSPEESVPFVQEENVSDFATKTSLSESHSSLCNIEESSEAAKPEIQEQLEGQTQTADVCVKPSLLQRSQLPSEDILQTDDELEVAIAEDLESDGFSPHPDTDDRPRVCAEQMFHTAKEGDDRPMISPFEVDSSYVAQSQNISIEDQKALVETTSTTAGESEMASTVPDIKEKEASPTILSDGGEEMSEMVMLENLEMSTDHCKESPNEIFQQNAELCEEVEESADLFAISSPEEEKIKVDPLIVSYAEAIVDTAVDTAVNTIIESKDETSEVLSPDQKQVLNANELIQPVTPIQPSSDTINVDSHETVIDLCESVTSIDGLQVTKSSHTICVPSDIKDEDDFESDDALVELTTQLDTTDINKEISSKSDTSSMKEKSPVRRISITEESIDDGTYVDMIDDIKEHVAIQEETSDLVQLQSSDIESENELNWEATKSVIPAATQQLMDEHEMIIERTEVDDPHAMQTIQEIMDDIPQSAQSSETGIDSDTLGVVETTVSHSHESESGMTESGMTLDGFEMPTEENFERDRSFTPFDSEEPQSSGISVSESNLPSQSTLEVVTDSGFVLLGETATYMPAATDSQMSENIMEDSHLQTDVSTSIASDSTMHDDEFPRKSICTPDLVDEALTHESELMSSPSGQTGQDDQISAFQAESKESVIDRNDDSLYPGSLAIESHESSHQSVILEPESPDFHEARILDDDDIVEDAESVRKESRQPVVIETEETRDSRIMEDLKEDTEGELYADQAAKEEEDDEEEEDEDEADEEEEDEDDEEEEDEDEEDEDEEDDDDIVEECEDGFKVIIRREPTHPMQDVDVEESTLSPIPECRESLESSPESYGKVSSVDVTKPSTQSSRSLGHLPISESADDLGDNSTSIGSFTTVIHPESLEGDQEGRLAVISGDKREREGSHDQTSGTISSLESDLEIVSKSDFDLPQTGSAVVGGLTDVTTASKTSVQSEPIPVTIRSADSLPLSSPGVSATAVASNTKESSSLTSSLSEFERLEGETTLQGSEQSVKTTDSSGSDRQRQDAPPSMTSSLAEFERLEKELDVPAASSPQQQKPATGDLELSRTSLNEFETLERQCDLGGAESQSFGSKEEEEMSDSSDSSSSSSSLADFVGLEESLLSEELSIEANKIVKALESGELPTAPHDDTAPTENVINISNRVCSGDSISEAEVMSPMRESVSFGDSVSRIQELLTAGNSSAPETINEKQRIEQDEPITAEMAMSSYSEGNVDEADSLEEEGEAPFHEDVSVVSAIPATRRPAEHDKDSLGGHEDIENSEHSRRSREVDSDSLGGGEDVMEESLTSMSSSIMQVSVDSLHAPMVSSGVIRVAGNLVTTEPDVMEENEEERETRQPEVHIPPGMETSVDSLEQFQIMERSVDSLDEAQTASAPFVPRTDTSGVMETSTSESHSVQIPQPLSTVTAAGNLHPASESSAEAKTLPSHHSSTHSHQSQPSSLPQQSPAHIPPSTSLAPDHGSCDPTSKSGRD